MKTPTVNVDLLRRVLEYITEHPEKWNQGVWARRDSCGTAYCLAGHTVVMTGHQIDWTATISGTADFVIAESGDYAPFISDVAAEELGLDDWQADSLFCPENDLATLWHLAAEFTHGAIEVPAQFRDGAA